MNPTNVTLNYTVPTVASDGSLVAISDADVPTLTFIQARTQGIDEVLADVVASVRLNNIVELEQLRDAINETIDKHSKREK